VVEKSAIQISFFLSSFLFCLKMDIPMGDDVEDLHRVQHRKRPLCPSNLWQMVRPFRWLVIVLIFVLLIIIIAGLSLSLCFFFFFHPPPSTPFSSLFPSFLFLSFCSFFSDVNSLSFPFPFPFFSCD